MYFETGQGSALSANAHHGIDQQTCEARAYAVAKRYEPLLVNTVVGFIGPEYLYDGKQITRAGLEDHFCGKLMGLPMGCDVCYTNHAEADQDDMDVLLTLLAAAGCNYIMGVPGADDIILLAFLALVYVVPFLGVAEWSVTLPKPGVGQYERLASDPLVLSVFVRTFRICAIVTVDIRRGGLRHRLCLGARNAAAAAADRALHPDSVLDFDSDARFRLAGAAFQSRSRQ